MRATRIAYLIVLMVSVVAIGLGVPYFSLRAMAEHVISEWMGLAIAIVALLVAGTLGFFGFVFFKGEPFAVAHASSRERELELKIKSYRARQRALLEEMDEVVKILRDIRDLLRQAEGEIHEG
ncbi:MAG: hypothetical protein DRN15_03260 [Thermoprotei archaeon]|nr:MAG: hypothetical protein DRN15_03260 [Thermoprotei archaeon]